MKMGKHVAMEKEKEEGVLRRGGGVCWKQKEEGVYWKEKEGWEGQYDHCVVS